MRIMAIDYWNSQLGRNVFVTSVPEGTIRFEYEREVCALEFVPKGVNRETHLTQDIVTYDLRGRGVFYSGDAVSNIFLKYFEGMKSNDGLLRPKQKSGLVRLLHGLKMKKLLEGIIQAD